MPRWQGDAECSIQKQICTMEAINFYRDNVAFLFRHFDGFKSVANYYMAPVPFEVKYELSLKKGHSPFHTIRLVKAPISIGALFLCWETYPELFRVPCGKDGEKTGMVYSFNGSPLSGANDWSAVCLETGEHFHGNGDKNFRARCEALNAAVIQSEDALEEMKKRKGLSDFTPASLQELVEYVKGIADD